MFGPIFFLHIKNLFFHFGQFSLIFFLIGLIDFLELMLFHQLLVVLIRLLNALFDHILILDLFLEIVLINDLFVFFVLLFFGSLLIVATLLFQLCLLFVVTAGTHEVSM
jgi:hypothetical protein